MRGSVEMHVHHADLSVPPLEHEHAAMVGGIHETERFPWGYSQLRRRLRDGQTFFEESYLFPHDSIQIDILDRLHFLDFTQIRSPPTGAALLGDEPVLVPPELHFELVEDVLERGFFVP